jgi:hypothetical protein
VSSDLLDPIRGRDRDLIHRRWVDPRGGWRRLLQRPTTDEALGVASVDLVEHALACCDDVRGPAVVHVDGMQKRESDVKVVLMRRSS